MKPGAPAQIRGEFRPIVSRVPGTRVCEHLPRLAGLAGRFALIRSMTHRNANHNPASFYVLSGAPPNTDQFDIRPSGEDFPNFGAVLAKVRPGDRFVPPFVQLSRSVVGDGGIQMPGQGAGFLGGTYEPFKITADPSDPGFAVEGLRLPADVPRERLVGRYRLLKRMQEGLARLGDHSAVQQADAFQRRAVGVVTSPAAREALALGREPTRLRDRYGRHTVGQSLLLARRLVEAGVRLVSVYWGGPLQVPDDYWDTHKGNFVKQRDRLLPRFDQCLSALLEDLHDRGLLDSTLVLSMGEFGRTPKIGQDFGNATDKTGRDHWPGCYTILLAGGGVAGGAVIGKSDRTASAVSEQPVTPEDITATVHHTLGVPEDAEIADRLGRPLPLTRGRPVLGLFG
jgi:hypothetical protein